MRTLLDTHAFLWFFSGDSKLSSKARAEIEDPETQNFLSVASLWETAIKASLEKLALSKPFDEIMPKALADVGCHVLPVELSHLNVLVRLAFHHRDPFDRMLVAQATAEQMSVVSADASFDAYGIARVW